MSRSVVPSEPSKNRARKDAPSVVLSIAGFDPSSGAGITADLQVFAAHGLFGISAITALTLQSTQGVAAVEPVSPAILRDSLHQLADDMPIAGVKIGMLGSREAAVEVAAFLESWVFSSKDGSGRIPIVLDPVLRASSGAALLGDAGLSALSQLMELVSWVTPNWHELGVLSGSPVHSKDDALTAMNELTRLQSHLNVVATGGDRAGEPRDLWRAPDGHVTEVWGERIETTSTHGTGCAFSSALLSGLVLGRSAEDAVRGAKTFVEGALRHAPGLGRGRGPMDLLWPLRL